MSIDYDYIVLLWCNSCRWYCEQNHMGTLQVGKHIFRQLIFKCVACKCDNKNHAEICHLIPKDELYKKYSEVVNA